MKRSTENARHNHINSGSKMDRRNGSQPSPLQINHPFSKTCKPTQLAPVPATTSNIPFSPRKYLNVETCVRGVHTYTCGRRIHSNEIKRSEQYTSKKIRRVLTLYNPYRDGEAFKSLRHSFSLTYTKPITQFTGTFGKTAQNLVSISHEFTTK